MNNAPTPTSPKKIHEFEKDRILGTKYFTIFVISLIIGLLSGFFGFLVGYLFFYPEYTGETSRLTIINNEESNEAKNIYTAVEKIRHSIVYFINKDTKDFLGAGVIITSDGYLLTTNNIFSNFKSVAVLDYEGNEYKITKQIDDNYSETIFLKIDAENLKPVSFVNSENIKIGELGFLYNNFASTKEELIKTSLREIRNYKTSLDQNYIYSYNFLINEEAPNNFKGLPLINYNGDIIGLIKEGNYILPSNSFESVINTVISEDKTTRPNVNISYRNISSLTPKEKLSYVLHDQSRGAYIISSKIEGLLPGDIVLYVGDNTVDEDRELVDVLLDYSKDDEVEIMLIRDGKQATIQVKL